MLNLTHAATLPYAVSLTYAVRLTYDAIESGIFLSIGNENRL